MPILVAALPTLREDRRRAVARELLRQWSPPLGWDWRSWNWGRARAWEVVERHEAELRALAH